MPQEMFLLNQVRHQLQLKRVGEEALVLLMYSSTSTQPPKEPALLQALCLLGRLEPSTAGVALAVRPA
jgi:hypothetical protein